MYSQDGALIHITGDTKTTETVVDPLAGIALNNVVKICRKVEVKEFRIMEASNKQNNYV